MDGVVNKSCLVHIRGNLSEKLLVKRINILTFEVILDASYQIVILGQPYIYLYLYPRETKSIKG